MHTITAAFDRIRDTLAPEPKSAPMLGAIARSGKHIYAGTVPAGEVARRRAANKRARVSRRANRGRR